MHLLEFTRDGRQIVVGTPSGVTLVDAVGARLPRELSREDPTTIAAIGDQIWVVAASTLTAFDRDGEVLDTLRLLGTGRFQRAGAGLLAGWMGETCATIAFDRGFVATEHPGAVEFVLPISSRRSVVASRGVLALRDLDTTRWNVLLPGRVTEATLVFDGKALAVAAHAAGSTTILVLGLRDGALVHRISVGADDTVRFAAHRGLALVTSPDARLVLIDLRFGRVVVDHREAHPIVASAIDEGGRDVAMVLADQATSIVHVSVAELIAAQGQTPPPAIEPAVEIAVVDEPAKPTEPEAAKVDPFYLDASLACDALPPRLAMDATTPEETTVLDVHSRRLTIAIAGLAIARAWDEGRLAYPQTGGLPFFSEVSGLTSGQQGLAVEEIAASERRLAEARAAELEARRAIAPRQGPLDVLEAELGLSLVAREMLLLAAAPALWGETARLYGILSNDDGRPLLDELLLAELLADRASRAEIARELDDDAPLVRLGILRVQAGTMRPFLPIVIEPVVLKILRGASVEPELSPLTEIRIADRNFASLRIPVATKRALVEDLGRARGPLRLAIRGRVGSGRHTLAAAIAAASGRQLGVIDATSLARDPRQLDRLASALDRANLAGLVPCVDGLELLPSQDIATHDRVREIFRRHAGAVIVRLPSEVQPQLSPGYVQVDLPTLSLSDRLATWEYVLAAHALTVAELPELADRYAVGPGIVERVAASVEGETGDAGIRLDAAIRQHLESRLANTADRVARLANWSQIILPPDIEDSLTELIARIKHRRIVFDAWGFDRLLSTSRGVTALFQGGPGTGKTLVASAIANELGMDLYRVDLSRVMSKWIGETEQNLAKLFDAAEDGNTIILFDEADSLFAKRTEVKSSVDRYANLEVNYLLQRIDSFEGIAILTTNFGTSIDAAFKRRLSLRLTFPFPDEDMREKLWRAHLPAEMPRSGDFDLEDLARRYQISGGYIRNVALRAAFLAAEEHSALTQEHLERAIKAEFREIGKIAESGVLE